MLSIIEELTQVMETLLASGREIPAIDLRKYEAKVIEALALLAARDRGNRIFYSSGPPDDAVGQEGDMAVNRLNGDFYEYKGGAFAFLFNAVPSQDASGGDYVFTDDILVSLSGGKTAGKYVTGQTIPAKGKTPQVVLADLFSETLYPGYSPAGLGLEQSAPVNGEVGEGVANTLTATFYRNDAGALAAVRIYQNGAQLGEAGSASPFGRTSNVSRTLAPITFTAKADYAAGPRKNISPGNTPDPRPAQVRSSQAPQAAEANLPSNATELRGYYRLYFGPLADNITSRAMALALGGTALTSEGSTFTLNTGTSASRFCIILPPSMRLVSVTDEDNLKANLTGAYVAQESFSLADAGGHLVYGYTAYVLTAATPYGNSARHQFTIASIPAQ